MIEVTLRFSDDQARRIEWLLRKRFKKDKRTSLTRLCHMAVLESAQVAVQDGLKTKWSVSNDVLL